MAKIVKKDIAEKLAEQFDITKKLATAELDFIVDEIVKQLKEGNTVSLKELGKFEVQAREARTGINPTTQEKITIEAKKAVKFKPATTLKDELN